MKRGPEGKEKRRAAALARRGAFTLVEILMVVSILGVVAAVASVNFGRSVERLKYNYLVRATHNFFGRARVRAIVDNAVQVVVCDFKAQTLVRRSRHLEVRSDGVTVKEVDAETLDLPSKTITLREWDDASKAWRDGPSDPKLYVFLPDGLGNSYEPLQIGLERSGRMAAIRRNSRGRVQLALGVSASKFIELFPEK